MSTRATYEFKPTVEWQPPQAFYIHYDGYPEGAARYFYAMLMHPNDRGGLAAKFIRANDLAEFTTGHDGHGDTEYQYTVEGGNDAGAMLTVSHRHPGGDKWGLVYSGTVAGFLDQYPEMLEDAAPFKLVAYGYRRSWLNAPLAQAALDESIRTLTVWAENTKPDASPVNEGNWRSQAKTAAALLAAFPADLKVAETVEHTRHRFNAAPVTKTLTVPAIVRAEVEAEVEKLSAKGGA